MNFRLLIAVCITATFSTCLAQSITVETAFSVPESIRPKLNGKIQAKYRFRDKLGSHVLVLKRTKARLSDGTDKITLHALQYDSSATVWRSEWVIQDNLSCKDLDIDAEFLIPLTSISDIDSNGIAETTVAYHLACLGGIDTKPTKAILRQGKLKHAVRGESLIQFEGAPSFGGIFTADPSLDKSPAFKSHLISIWKKAAGVQP